MSKIEVFRNQILRFVELVQHFAQDELGCGCGQDVFEQVRILIGEATPGVTRLGLVVGERLFIGFVDAESIKPVESHANKLVRTAVTYRDAMKLNRVRLVIDGKLTEEERSILESEAGKYENVHVHIFE